MAAKRRARMVPASRGSSRPHSSRRGRTFTRSPLLLLALIAVTVVALATILVLALNQGSSASTATPTAIPTGAASTSPSYSAEPAAGIGVIDNNSGLAQAAARPPKVGQPAPDFDWRSTTGSMRLSAMRGHPVLLEFFAPWCAQCKQDAPLLNGIVLQSQYKGTQVLSVSATAYGKDYETSGSEQPIGMGDLAWFHTTYGTAYTEIFDPNMRIWNLYGRGSSYPTFFLIDAKGTVRFTTSQYISNNDLLAQIAQVLQS